MLYTPHCEAFCTESFSKLGSKVVGYAAYEVDGELWTSIGQKIATDKAAELIHGEIVHLGGIDVSGHEGCKRGHEAVGPRLAVDTVDGQGDRQSRLAEKGLLKGLGKKPFEHVGQKPTPQGATTPLVANNIAE